MGRTHTHQLKSSAQQLLKPWRLPAQSCLRHESLKMDSSKSTWSNFLCMHISEPNTTLRGAIAGASHGRPRTAGTFSTVCGVLVIKKQNTSVGVTAPNTDGMRQGFEWGSIYPEMLPLRSTSYPKCTCMWCGCCCLNPSFALALSQSLSLSHHCILQRGRYFLVFYLSTTSRGSGGD